MVIVGGGSIGLAAAVDLTRRGYRIDAIIEADQHRAASLRCAGRIRLTGLIGDGELPDPPVSSSCDAVSEADTVLIATTADRYEHVAQGMANHVFARQLVVLATGYVGGAARFAAALRRHGTTIADTPAIFALNTSPYLSYADGQGAVHVAAAKSWMEATAVSPGIAKTHADAIASLFPGCVVADEQMASSLNNPNPIAHVPAYVLNATQAQNEAAGRIPAGGAFHLSDVTSVQLENLRTRLDDERLEVMAALGFASLALSRGDFGNRAYGPGAREASPPRIGPTFQRRFLVEDVPFGLIPLEMLAQRTGTPVPSITGLIDLVNGMTGVDYRAAAPALADLGVV
ncbi:NAD/NADP octopine/nopaline dehydrogenase family protein [Microbacterium sp. ASV81]|uniref:NAD/NADP octopine/nopaline dehydrogenase family protein n=1 Tax=Microbacterium capsulatum TaxID=3041921 RepID=A0ABU0XD96_9MICO|nr:NAD/NADP octopine/nopaline dehydrogenase family protein [Microbacterium sp. ASV81]MDQ4213091.1 NAD/NADP octopine/nopaline dehydrogenase family protein [Microbacterium sp. ASV81]